MPVPALSQFILGADCRWVHELRSYQFSSRSSLPANSATAKKHLTGWQLRRTAMLYVRWTSFINKTTRNSCFTIDRTGTIRTRNR